MSSCLLLLYHSEPVFTKSGSLRRKPVLPETGFAMSKRGSVLRVRCLRGVGWSGGVLAFSSFYGACGVGGVGVQRVGFGYM